jgi:hypothetical protein
MEKVLKYFKSFTATLIQFLSNLREETKLTKEKRKETLSGSVLTKKTEVCVWMFHRKHTALGTPGTTSGKSSI